MNVTSHSTTVSNADHYGFQEGGGSGLGGVFDDRPPGPSGALSQTPLSALDPAQVLYLQEPGTSAPISVADLFQGQLGDCFLISSVGELAINDARAIRGMIHANANGTETVTLYEDAHGWAPTRFTTAFKQVEVTVTNSFPGGSVDNGATQDVVGSQKEIWPQVLEKAVATFDGGYGAIANGGNPTTTMMQLTGQPASYMSAAGVTLSQLQSWAKAADLVTFDTASSGDAAYNLVGDHSYMFEGLTTVGGAPAVKLGNPWGFDQPSAVPVSKLASAFMETDVGRA